MNPQIESTKNDFLSAKDGLLKSLATTPDDRISWSPSPSARSPLHIAVHAAEAMGFLHEMLLGKPFHGTTEEADRAFREHEKGFTSREEVVALIGTRSQALSDWFDALTEERLSETAPMPFGIGPVPIGMAMTFPALHTRWHTAQIDYVQTIYGDRDWHA